MVGLRVSAVVVQLFIVASAGLAQSGVPSTYHAISNRNVYPKPATPPLGAAGWRFTDPTFGSRMLRVTDGDTRPGFPGRSYSTPSAAHQLAWNATSDRFYVRSLDGWFIPYNFDPLTMTATRIQPTTTGNGGLLVSSQVEPQFSFISRDIIFGSTRDQSEPLIDYPVVHQFDLATGQYTTLLNLREVTDVAPNTYAGALSSSATSPERVSIMFGGPGQDSHFKVAVFEVASPPASVAILNTQTSQITRNGKTFSTSSALGFRLHHAWLDQTGRWVLLSPVNATPAHHVVWDMTTDTFTPVTRLPFGHDALGYGWQVNQDCCASGAKFDGAQWQLRSLATPNTSTDLINPQLSPQQTFLADHTSWNNAQPDRRVPVLSSLYRYYKNTLNTTPWRAWDDELVAIQTNAASGGTVWRFAHHRSNITMDVPGDGTYFWYQPHAVISPNGRWALFTSNWEKTLGVATGSEPEGVFRTDVFIVRLMAGAFTDAVLTGLPIRAIHFIELRDRIDLLRLGLGLGVYPWNDPDLGPGFTVRAVHLLDLRTAVEQAYAAANREQPVFSEVAIVGGLTIIRASQIEELRTAVIDLEGG